MSFSNDETSEVVYLTVQALNNNQTDSKPSLCLISQQSNDILKNMSEWNIYVQSITLNSENIPFCNFYRNINWNNANFQVNKTNLSISIMSNAIPTEYPFIIPDDTNKLVVGINEDPANATHYKGITCFLQYYTENANVNQYSNPNPNGTITAGYSSQSYPRGYFNLKSLNHFINMINNALNMIISYWTNPANPDIGENSMYMAYDSITQLYSLYMPDAFKTDNFDLYFNTFLRRIIDGFRTQYYQHDDVSSPSYNGLDYKLVKNNYPFNKDANNVWTYQAEYATIQNIVDIHSVLVVANSGDLQNISQQYIPATLFQQQKNPQNVPSISALKSLDIDLTSLNFNAVNNSFIQFESSMMAYPINTLNNNSLRNINIQIFIQNIDNEIYALSVPASSGYCNVRLACKKKKI